MKLNPIIKSLLETDAYKLNMMQVVLHQLNKDKVVWAFKCRNDDVRFTPEMVSEIREQIDYVCGLRFTDEELTWLRSNFQWLSDDFIEYLRIYKLDRKNILINEGDIQAYNDCGLAIEAHGTELQTMLFEIYVLAIVNEVYFSFKYGPGTKDIEFQKRTMEKFSKFFDHIEWECYLNDDNKIGAQKYMDSHPYEVFTFSEFGLRRRYSGDMQDWLIKYIVNEKTPGFVGTSNVYLAKKYGVKAVGTQAHEFFELFQGHFELNPAYSNRFAMKAWTKEYETELGIALTDTIGTDVFLKDFGLTFATLFSGVRHDSGDPIEWGEKMIAHYKSLGIDPKTKTLLFSDSLDFERATKIKKHFEGVCKIAFGIGTYLSNDTDVKPLNIVMKIVEVNNHPVAKISNTPGKGMCKDKSYEEYLKRCIDWRLKFED